MQKTEKVLNIRFSTDDGCGVGKFISCDDGHVILDETTGEHVIPQHTYVIGNAHDFGSLRTLFGWNVHD